MPELAGEPKVEYLDALYLADPADLFALVAHAPDTAKALMLLGHNPGLEQVAAYLSRVPVKRKARDQMDLMEEKFPTCALAVLDFDIERWNEMEARSGVLVDFVRPRDLR